MAKKMRRPKYKELRAQIEADFEEIHNKLRYIEKLYNPSKLNLHFDDLSRADAELYKELLVLSREGLKRAKRNEEYFSSHPLYDDGMFWYELFLLISSAALRIIRDGDQADIPKEIVKTLTKNLIEITPYSTFHLGDITKRNYEALCNTLIAFFSEEILEFVNRRMEPITSKRAKEVIDRAIRSAKELVKDKNKK